jgi:competence protein ComEC
MFGKKPAALLVLSFALGISFSLTCKFYCFSLLAAGCGILICASCLALRGDRLSLSLVLGLSAIAIAGLLTSLTHRDAFSAVDLRSRISRGVFRLNEPVAFEGCVAEESEKRGDDYVATIDLRASSERDIWTACRGKAILHISGQPSDQALKLMRGDRITGWATWNIPRNFRNPGSADRAGSLARRGIFLVGRAKSSRLLQTVPGDCSDILTRFSNSVRNRVRRSLDPIKRERRKEAAILASLTIGDYSELDNYTREVFQNSGTFHVLVVSGLHVAWIAGLLLKFFKLAGLPDRLSSLLSALAIWLYTCIVGFQASITRCLWMFILYLAGRALSRRADPVNILFASALIILAIEPDWLFEAGFQLSFLSVMAITLTAVPVIQGYLRPLLEPLQHSGNSVRLFLQRGPWHQSGRRLRTRFELLAEALADRFPPIVARPLLSAGRIAAKAGFGIGNMIIISAAIQLWLEPVLAGYFNRMSWISPLANLVIVPLSSMVLSAGALRAFTSGFFWSDPFVQIAGSLASLLLHLAARTTMFPGSWQRCPTPSASWIVAGVLLLLWWSLFEWRRFWIPCAYVVLLLSCLSYGSIPVLGILISHCKSKSDPGPDKIRINDSQILSFTFLDVGEGDSIVIGFPDGRFWMVDGGGFRLPVSQEEEANGLDIGEAVVSRYLWQQWITNLDRLVLSHTDLDHAGGIPAVMKNFRINRFEHPQQGSDLILSNILDTARQERLATRQVHAGMEEKAGLVQVHVLNPPPDSTLGSANENSVVLGFHYRNFSALLTGDLEKSGETGFLSRVDGMRFLLLKAAHHGSRWGTSDGFLDRIQPRWAIVSVGRNNPYGHPSKEVLQRLARHGVRSILTCDCGAVTFETDGYKYVCRSYAAGVLGKGEL